MFLNTSEVLSPKVALAVRESGSVTCYEKQELSAGQRFIHRETRPLEILLEALSFSCRLSP